MLPQRYRWGGQIQSSIDQLRAVQQKLSRRVPLEHATMRNQRVSKCSYIHCTDITLNMHHPA